MPWEVVGLVALIVVCGFMVVRVLSQKPEKKKTPTPASAPAVRAAKDLPAFHLLTRDDLDVGEFKAEKREAELKKYENRRLLAAMKMRDPFTDAALPTKAASAYLNDTSLTASIPATPATILGGRLKIYDVVELASAGPAKGKTNRVQNLVVIGLPAEAPTADKTKGEGAAAPGAVVLALTGDKFDDFMAVVGGESLVLLRPNAGANQ